MATQGGPPPGGNVTTYDTETGLNGEYYVSNGKAPAYWNHEVYFPPDLACGTEYNFKGITFAGYYEYEVDHFAVENLDTIEWDCTVSNYGPPSTSFAIAGNIPSSITIPTQNPSGGAFTSQYGMPIAYIYDSINGAPNLVSTVTASVIAPGGANASFPLPGSLDQNAYALVTANANSSGSYVPNGVGFFSVAGSQTVAGTPFGVAAGGGTMNYYDCNWDPDYGQYCWSGATTYAIPVVSLYSSNQVLVNGNTTLDVGPNPTPVAANSTGSTSTSYDDGSGNTQENDYSGSTIAIVANSGGNTISVIDIINAVVLFTIPVGNQPVALAMSADGTSAYVANYSDSTVTAISPTNGTAGATISVGGQPTSLALTSGGILWVGGPGFVTEVNAQTMSVIATETTGSKAIIGLGYSDKVGQLVATSVDQSGNVYADQINPATFTAGGSYQPLASNLVSTLGTHLNTRTNSEERSFTDTLVSSVNLNVNQPGAPPLVVQDGWAVITATPTGFAITDITGNIVLVTAATALASDSDRGRH